VAACERNDRSGAEVIEHDLKVVEEECGDLGRCERVGGADQDERGLRLPLHGEQGAPKSLSWETSTRSSSRGVISRWSSQGQFALLDSGGSDVLSLKVREVVENLSRGTSSGEAGPSQPCIVTVAHARAEVSPASGDDVDST
jgi:hypothetical protein